MRRKVSRLIKNTLIFLRLDSFIADKYHKTHWWIFKKLIPDRTFYSIEEEKIVKRNNTLFKIQPADFTQWLLFRDMADSHVDAALKVIDPNRKTLILDIGANCGNFSLILAQIINAKKWSKQLIAFEPNPRIFHRITYNLNLNPSLKEIVKLVNKGVGEEPAMLELQLPLRNTGAGSLIRNYEHEPHEKHLVKIISIDDFLSDSEYLPVEFMKIDVENFEFYVLIGAARTIAKYKPAIYIEMGIGQVKGSDIFLFFKNHGYTLYGEDGKQFVLIEEENSIVAKRFRNILAISSDINRVN